MEDKGVNPNKIKLIICTHWHEDHIAGMGKLLDTSSDAIFSFARATDLKKFLNFVSLDYQKLNTSASNASTKEFNNCLDILIKSQRTAKLAEVDKLLYSANEDNGSFEVWALSSR